jgi:micrococcal nuclease
MLGTYWALIALLMGASIFFTREVQSRRRAWQPAAAIEVASGSEVTAVEVFNGDELAVRAGDDVFVVRLLGIKTFDAKSNDASVAGVGAVSIQGLRRAIEGKTLTIVYDDYNWDRHKRLLAYLEADGEDVGALLIAHGQALAFVRFPFSREHGYIASASAARTRSEGLWGHPKAATRAAALEITWKAQRNAE